MRRQMLHHRGDASTKVLFVVRNTPNRSSSHHDLGEPSHSHTRVLLDAGMDIDFDMMTGPDFGVKVRLGQR